MPGQQKLFWPADGPNHPLTLKILYPIGTLYPSQEGGPSNTVYWMAKALTARGVEVTIITTNLGAETKVPADRWMSTAYGRIIYHSALYHLLPVKMLFSIWKTMPDCDITHLTSLFYPPSLLSAIIAKWHKKPVVWSPRGELDEKALAYSNWKKRPYLWFIKRLRARHITFHSTSAEESERIRAVFGKNTQVVEIPNFIELPQREKPANGTPYLLCVGRIHPQKALDNLIEALPVSKQFMQTDIVLKIAGDDQNDYGGYLKKKVAGLGLQEKVEFTGLVEGAEKQSLYAGACFSLLPSHTENFGNVVIESLAQGTPVIASTGTPWAILEREKAGFWTDNSPEALAQAIDAALSLQHETRMEYRKNALELVQRQYDIRKNIALWIKTYRSVLQVIYPDNITFNAKHS